MAIKVLHILDHSLPYFSGYSFRTNSILTNQKKFDIKPIALTSPKHEQGTELHEEINGVRYFRCRFDNSVVHNSLGKLPFVREKLQISLMQRHIEQLLSTNDIDILHAHSPSLNGISAIRAAKMFCIPVVYEVRAFWEDAAVNHGSFFENSMKYKISSMVETWLMQNVALITTLGNAMKQEMIKRGISPDKIHVVPNGVDLNQFKQRQKDGNLVQSLGLSDKTVFGFIGSFYRYEGLDVLIHAMKKVLRAVPDSVLLLVGDGDQRPALEKLTIQFGLSEHIKFVGKVAHDKVINYYSVLDILVYPRNSIRLTELVTPLKPLEAMAMRKATIGSDVGGIKEMVKHGKTGLLFRADDVDDLAKKCITLATDIEFRDSIASAAHQYVEEERNWQTIISKYYDIYLNSTKQVKSIRTNEKVKV